MELPFTEDQFFDLFAAYNTAWWPAAVALWIASLAGCVLLARSRHSPDRWISALLAAHWVWSGLAYHAAFFTRINPAAWLFAALFVVQGAFFFWAGVLKGRVTFDRAPGAWAPIAWLLVAYALLYPAINALEHHSVVRIPGFGVPCPTTIFTAGLLMLSTPQWRLSVIPIAWSMIGGSAALVLNVHADYGLGVAGAALLAFSLSRWLGRRVQTPVWKAVPARRGPKGEAL